MEKLKWQERQPYLRYSESARRALSYAQKYAYAFGVHVGTNEVYLGVTQEISSLTAVSILLQNEISPSRFSENLKLTQFDDHEKLQPTQESRLTLRAKRVVELAVQHARDIKATQVGATHLLIGLARDAEATRQQLDNDVIFNHYKCLSEGEKIAKREIPHSSTISANPH